VTRDDDGYLSWVQANRAWWCEQCGRLTTLTPEQHVHDADQADE
jgi:hypothetical protein